MLDMIDEPLVSFSEGSPILATEVIAREGVKGLGDQFITGASDYDDRYVDVEPMIRKLSGSVEISGFLPPPKMKILDIGCGSGNATMALANMFPHAEIVATDLSPNLLEILAKKAERFGLQDRVTCVVADASAIKLKPGSFDIVCGSSMLHHLVDPETVLNGYIESLNPNGIGMFFEPFHAGNFVIRQVIIGLRHLAKYHGGVEDEDLASLDRFVFGIDFVTQTDRSHPVLKELDDKWLFSKEMFRRVAKRFDKEAVIYTANPASEGYKDKIGSMLYSVSGRRVEWPAWALEFFADIDSAEKGELADDILMEGCTVFK